MIVYSYTSTKLKNDWFIITPHFTNSNLISNQENPTTCLGVLTRYILSKLRVIIELQSIFTNFQNYSIWQTLIGHSLSHEFTIFFHHLQLTTFDNGENWSTIIVCSPRNFFPK